MKRVPVLKSTSLKELYEMVYKALNLIDYGFSLFTDRDCSKEIHSTRSSTIAGSKLNHGDIVYYKQMAGTSSVCIRYIIEFQACIS